MEIAANLLKTFALLAALTSAAHAAPGALDPTFGRGGIVTTAAVADNAWISAIASDRSRRLLAAGATQDVLGGHIFPTLARYQSDGTLDTGFGDAGGVVTFTAASGASADASFNALAVDGSGRILAGGYASVVGPAGFHDVLTLVRYNNDGRLDATFGSGGVVQTTIVADEFDARINALALDAMGRIVAAGEASDRSGNGTTVLLRYNNDGSLDATFARTGMATITTAHEGMAWSAMRIDSVGRIVVAGWRASAAWPQHSLVARYYDDGELDLGFGTDGTGFAKTVERTNVFALALDGRDRIVVGGANNTALNYQLMRIDSNGRFDTTFGPAHTGIVTTTLGAAGENSAVTGVAIDRAGHILAGGVLYSLRATSMSLVRYTTDGNPDTTFGIGGVTFVSATPPNRYRASALVLDASNRIVLGGYGYEHAEYEFATARFGN